MTRQILPGTLLALALLAAGCGGSTYSSSGSGGGMTGTSSPLTSEALGINDSGYVVGVATDSDWNRRAVLFVPQNGTVPTYSVSYVGSLGGGETHASAISSQGWVTGWSRTGSSESHAFLYMNNTMTDIGTLGGDFGSAGMAINDNGYVVGTSFNQSFPHPFVYSTGTGFHSVPTPDGMGNATMTGINDAGVMVGVFLTSSIEQHSFVALLDDTTTDLQPLGVIGQATAINNGAYIVGDASPTGGWWYQETLAYTTLSNHGGTIGNLIYGVNNSQVIAGEDLIGGRVHAVTFTNGVEKDLGVLGAANVVDLNTLIPPADLATVGLLTDATGINANGQICCNSTSGKAVVLTPI